jgi:tetratricopeptide (TPR) repeat protein
LDWIVRQVWPELWKDLGLAGKAPELDQALKAVKSSGLADAQVLGEGVKYVIHPGVAQAGREEVEEKFRSAVDSEMASIWSAVFDEATSGKQEIGQWVVMAGLRSAPYLLRLERWAEASGLLEQAVYRDRSPETIASVIPLLRHIVQASKGTDREPTMAVRLAMALRSAGRWQEVEEMLRSLIPRCVSQGDFRTASVAAGGLMNILLCTGRFEEALKLAEQINAYTSRAGLGPWTQLLVKSMRLQALNALGRYDEVLKAVEELRVQMSSLPERGDQEESVEAWGVREVILDTGRQAALLLEKYEKALELNAECIAVTESRGATELELARTRFNDNFPLLKLERYDQDLELLLECKEIFELEKDIPAMGKVFGALAGLEHEMGHLDQAIRFGNDSLRYKYLTGDPEDISTSHRNLAIYLAGAGSDKALAHDLAVGIIDYLIHSGLLGTTLHNLSLKLARFGPQSLPSSFDQICRIVEEVEGVRFRELFHRLAGPDADGDQVMRAVIDQLPGGGT